jgi:hypothetical protein
MAITITKHGSSILEINDSLLSEPFFFNFKDIVIRPLGDLMIISQKDVTQNGVNEVKVDYNDVTNIVATSGEELCELVSDLFTDSSAPTGTQYVHSSTQWDRTLVSPESLPNGQTANGMTFFTPSDKVAAGTTSYDEYNIAFGTEITLSGTSGTANISVDGVNYLATFNTDLNTTASDWVALHGATLSALNVRVFALSSPARIRFCTNETLANSVSIANVSGDLNGVKDNPFTPGTPVSRDHILIPYTGQPYDGLRIHHTMRVNFGIATGSAQTLALSLRRFEDDSIIGSEIQIYRTQDVSGQQYDFETYTNSITDPFVTGGFYFALRNDSGANVDIEGNVGILIQNHYQKPVDF